MPKHSLLAAGMPEAFVESCLSAPKLAAAIAGYLSIIPHFVVWGKQPELVKKCEQVLLIRKDLLELPISDIIELVDRACAIAEIGRAWKGTSVKRAQHYRHVEVAAGPGPAGPGPSGLTDERSGVLSSGHESRRQDGKKYFEPSAVKICATCKQSKPAKEYHRRSSHKTGLQSNCIQCIDLKRKGKL